MEGEERILEYAWRLKKDGYRESTIVSRDKMLRSLARRADLSNPEAVNTLNVSSLAAVGVAKTTVCLSFLALNGFVQRQLSKLTSDWWKQRIPDDVRAEAQTRKERDQKPWGWYEVRDLDLIHYLTFADYGKIICKKDNWRDAFEEVFGDREMLLTRLRELEPIRNIVMHPSKPISQDQLDRLRLYAKDLLASISRTRKA